jgi:hypothetical protein
VPRGGCWRSAEPRRGRRPRILLSEDAALRVRRQSAVFSSPP